MISLRSTCEFARSPGCLPQAVSMRLLVTRLMALFLFVNIFFVAFLFAPRTYLAFKLIYFSCRWICELFVVWETIGKSTLFVWLFSYIFVGEKKTRLGCERIAWFHSSFYWWSFDQWRMKLLPFLKYVSAIDVTCEDYDEIVSEGKQGTPYYIAETWSESCIYSFGNAESPSIEPGHQANLESNWGLVDIRSFAQSHNS